jgi:hypothetical protein
MSINVLFSNETYGLKGFYEIEVPILGSDNVSINLGMEIALKELIVNLTGTTSVLDNKETIKLLSSPKKYVTEYRLNADAKQNLIATFLFNGNSLREIIVINQLPLWVGTQEKILVYLPCLHQNNFSASFGKGLDQLCIDLVKGIKSAAIKRKVILGFPSMDLVDMNLLDQLIPFSDELFMDRLAKRYNLKNWIFCRDRDLFGMKVETPYCSTSTNKQMNGSLINSFDTLVNDINQDSQILITNNEEEAVSIDIMGVSSHNNLMGVLENFKNNLLVKNLTLNRIDDDSINLSVKISGKESDFKKIMKVNSLFKKEPLPEEGGSLIFYLRLAN